MRRARIGTVDRAGRSWLVDVDGKVIEADSLVFTGPGDALRLPGQPVEHPRVLDGRTIWQHLADLPEAKIRTACVVGGGETAGAVTDSAA